MSGWPGVQGFNLQSYKPALYLFGSLLAVVFSVVLGISPLVAATSIMVLGVLKQLIWDKLLLKQDFDWLDIWGMLIGCGVGVLFTLGYYRLVA